MLQLLCLLALSSSVLSADQQTNAQFTELFGKKFKIPGPSVTGGLTADSLTLAGCHDAKIYNTEEAVAAIDTEEEYLCAFIAYQINKVEGEGVPTYSDAAEATARYPDFKKCVDNVIKYNAESDTAEFEVNFFCDMNAEEKGDYASSNYGGGDTSGDGFGLGSSNGGGSEKPPNNVIIQLFGEKFKMPESSATGGITAEDLQLADCVDKKLYNSEASVGEIDEEREYLCAFVAFQINKNEGEGIPTYSDKAEATKRYPLFKNCVDYVNKLNKETDKTEFGVNFFCDMTTEEKKPYANSGEHGHYGEANLGSGYDGGASDLDKDDSALGTTVSYIILCLTLANVFFTE